MREPRYSILSDINDGIDRAKQGKLALYWQRNIEHEYLCKKVTPAEQQAYTDLQDILAAVPQWSDEEELRSGMQPRQIIWGDGRTYPIEQVRDFRPASTIADLPGDCYTVIIKGQERHLFFERADRTFPSRFGRWFVEV